MNTASKRATAGTVTLSIDALAGASMSSPITEMTMEPNNTYPDGAPRHTVHVAEDRSRPLNPGEPQKFTTSLAGRPVVTRSSAPFFDSCRVLASWGFAGKVQFVDAVTGASRMSMSIPSGVKLTIEDGPSGPRTRKYRGAEAGEPTKNGGNVASRDQVADRELEHV